MTIMLGAEIINVSDINRWLENYPLHKFINEYGPTETTVASTFILSRLKKTANVI